MPWRIDPRVCEVVALRRPEDLEGAFGSGFALDNSVVLTARHVVCPDDFEASSWLVRPVEADAWVRATLRQPLFETDLAVLDVSGALYLPTDFDPVRFGRLHGGDRVVARAAGFPDARATRTSPDGRAIRDPEDLRGELRPAAGARGDDDAFDLWGSTPLKTKPGETPWGGVSGSAVFCGPLLVGVVSADPAHFGGDRLKVTMLERAGESLNEVLGLDGGLEISDRPKALAEAFEAPPTNLATTRSVRLLDPRYGVVPFAGRDTEIEQFVTWCLDGDASPVRLLIGDGGQGKSRLAGELTTVIANRGWMAGLLRRGLSDVEITALIEGQGPTLVVIDDAFTRIDDLLALASRITLAQGRLRILCLARSGGRWWDSLAEQSDAAWVFDGAEVEALDPIAVANTARGEVFAAAHRALARFCGVDADPPQPVLSDPAFESVLFLHLLALSALEPETKLDTVGGGVARRLLDEILTREDTRYWTPQAKGFGIAVDQRLIRLRAVAVAALTMPNNESQATKALAVIPGADATQCAHWLRGDQIGVPYLQPLRPDRLGEFLVNRTLEELPELLMDLVRATGMAHLTRMLTVLSRAATYSSVHFALTALLAEHIADYIDEIARSGDLTQGKALAAAFESVATGELATEVLQVLPERSFALMDLALVTNEVALDNSTSEMQRARLLNNQSNRLSDLGRREDALAAIEEAVEIRRRLADERPDAFVADLAASLNNQSLRLSDLGRREDSLAAIEEAVEIHRRLAEERPDAFVADLARSLTNQSLCLSNLGRREDALAAIDEAVGIRRRLAEERPDAFRADLALSLNNQSSFLSGLGRREDSLAAIDEAVEIYRRLADERPDAFVADLAMSLNNQSNRLSDLGRREDSLAAIDEAVGIYRRLADERPDAFRADLASSLNNQSLCLSDLGRREDSLAAIDEAVGIRRRLAEERPDAFVADLATSLTNQSLCLSDLGRREDALAAIDEAVEIYRRLADERPDAFVADLAMSLNNQSSCLSGLGRREDSLAAIEEAVGIRRRLADERPDAFVADLATSLTNQSLCLSDLGRREDSLAAIDEAVGIRRRLAEERPDAFVADLALSLNNQSSFLSGLGRREDALAAIDEAVGIYRCLADERPDAFVADLATSLTNQSNRLSDLGRREDSLAAIDEAVEIYRRLADERPDAFRADLALSLTNQSNFLSDLGRREDALAAIDEAVEIYRRLADERPDAFRADLALSLTNQSNFLSDLGRREDALAAIEEAVGIRRRLADERPDAFRADLARSLNNQSSCLSDLGRREDSLAAIEEAVEIHRRLAEERPDAFVADLARSLTNQSLCLSNLGRREDALAAIDEAVRTILPRLETAPYILPDAGLKLAQRYIACVEALDRDTDEELIDRMTEILVRAGVIEPDSGAESPEA